MTVAMTTRCTQQVDSGMAAVDDAELTVLRCLQRRNALRCADVRNLIFSLLFFTSIYNVSRDTELQPVNTAQQNYRFFSATKTS